jgi:hypothetical protein
MGNLVKERNFIGIFVLVLGLAGLGLLTGAYFAIRSELSFRASALSASGTVVDLIRTTDSRRTTVYRPVFEFTDRTDRVYRITGSVASDPPSYERGEKVTVCYRPDNPENAQLDSFVDSWLDALILGGLGVVFTSFCAGFVIYTIRRRRIRTWLAINGLRVHGTSEEGVR